MTPEAEKDLLKLDLAAFRAKLAETSQDLKIPELLSDESFEELSISDLRQIRRDLRDLTRSLGGLR